MEELQGAPPKWFNNPKILWAVVVFLLLGGFGGGAYVSKKFTQVRESEKTHIDENKKLNEAIENRTNTEETLRRKLSTSERQVVALDNENKVLRDAAGNPVILTQRDSVEDSEKQTVIAELQKKTVDQEVRIEQLTNALRTATEKSETTKGVPFMVSVGPIVHGQDFLSPKLAVSVSREVLSVPLLGIPLCVGAYWEPSL